MAAGKKKLAPLLANRVDCPAQESPMLRFRQFPLSPRAVIPPVISA
jgi:hypothetical protein